jgi:hypothetical protein
MNVGESPIGETAELAPNAQNLPSVLLQLPRNPAAHDRYLALLREIFPSIYRVTARPINSGTAKVEIIMSDTEAGAVSPGIDVPLSESGTGISQVLAILYVAVTAEFPRIIVIDEPNSFLHPGAAKKLISILRQFDHQYIVSTHSAELMRTADPEFVHLIEWEKTASSFRTLDRQNLNDQRRLLTEIGVNLSDVFGADSVLWVEGTTEEICFPLILEHLGLATQAISIQSLIATDDLTGSRRRARVRAQLAWDVYGKLSKGTALIPPALAFALDREGRSQTEMADLVRASGGTARFLPRRTYENYLIDKDAIAAILKLAIDAPIDVEDIARWIADKESAGAYLETPLQEGKTWIEAMNAPRFLTELFNMFSGAKEGYDKTEHSVLLTKWFLKNRPEQLNELCDFLRDIVAVPSRTHVAS